MQKIYIYRERDSLIVCLFFYYCCFCVFCLLLVAVHFWYKNLFNSEQNLCKMEMFVYVWAFHLSWIKFIIFSLALSHIGRPQYYFFSFYVSHLLSETEFYIVTDPWYLNIQLLYCRLLLGIQTSLSFGVVQGRIPTISSVLVLRNLIIPSHHVKKPEKFTKEYLYYL